ncbi:MAG: HAD family phosphatase [Calditrichaeota bacterium]|nr:HAD family phosphatase [Calditrichota bacterium]
MEGDWKGMVQHIIFDLGQVLVRVAFLDFAQRFAELFNTDAQLILNADDRDPHKKFFVGEISGEEFHREICALFGKNVSLEEFKKLWLGMLDGEIPESVAIVEELAQRNFSLSILSNIDAWHYDYCERNFSVMRLFSKKFLSFALRMKKPDPEIFKLVARELQTKPERCLLIDDTAENIEAAKKVGYQTIHFTDGCSLREILSQMSLLEN